MRLKWLAVTIVAVIVLAASVIVTNVELRSKVSDFIIGPGNDSGKNNTDNSPINNTDDGTGPPAKIEPVAYGYFKTMLVDLSVTQLINGEGQVTGYMVSAMIMQPNVQIIQFNGTADSVYEWAQGKPLNLFRPASNVTIEWWLSIEVQSQFNSAKYQYPTPEGGRTNVYEANWNSSHVTNSFRWSTWDSGSMKVSHTWASTGFIYYWENGGYNAFLSVGCKYTVNGVHFDGLASGGNLASYQVNV